MNILSSRNFKRQKFHVRKVKYLVRATERKMPFWIMEISANLDTRCRKSRDASNADKGAILKRAD